MKNQVYVVVAALLAVALVIFAFLVGRGCSAKHPQPVDDLGIDAGPGEAVIAAQLDGALSQVDAELQRIAAEHDEDIARFEGEQRRKYEEVSQQGPEALAGWFTDFNRSLRDTGP